MSVTQGMLTLDELTRLAESGTIESVLTVFPDLYGRLMGKRFDVHFFLDSIAKCGANACDYLLTVDMEMNPVQGYRFANWDKGYGDFHLLPDSDTLRMADWLQNTALILCDLVEEESHQLIPQAPRSILKLQVEKAAAIGYTVMAASELEYYVFKNSYKEAKEKGYCHLEPSGWYIGDYSALQSNREETLNRAVRQHLKKSGIAIEASKSEWGTGQHELNMQYCNVLNMSDNHVIFKQCAKDVADRSGLSVTFMAKYKHSQAGSSCHLHLSLWKNGQNAFSNDITQNGAAVSSTFRWFLGGWINHVPEMMLFYAPTVNSYKRYQPGSWAPSRLAWAFDNRTVAFRVVGKGDETRIECRLPGADCNPYLAYSAALASGLHGIENKIEPPPAFDGNAYVAPALPEIPRNLRDAAEQFRQSSFAIDTFGRECVEHYLRFYQDEQDSFNNAVTDWETERYFERI